MAAIPLGLIGVSIGFLVSGASIGLIALIGVVGLTGIVVNDSLVLVDFINARRERGMPLIDAIVEASRTRLRPILLTSITTIAGLMPLALGLGGRSPLLAPMATAISWGLTFSTVLILILIPCLYLATVRFTAAAGRLAAPVTRVLTDPGDAVDGEGAEQREAE
jgi:multidrug efflux pump subunit AcrB